MESGPGLVDQGRVKNPLSFSLSSKGNLSIG